MKCMYNIGLNVRDGIESRYLSIVLFSIYTDVYCDGDENMVMRTVIACYVIILSLLFPPRPVFF